MIRVQLLICFIALQIFYVLPRQEVEWNYLEASKLGPAYWHKYYPKCGGNRQSPIEFYADDVVVNKSLSEIVLIGYDQDIPANTLDIRNNGHSFHIDIKGSKPRIMHGGLPTWYQLHGLHFHWSNDDHKGSEHVVGDTRKYPLVIHWVHLKENLSVAEAVKHGDGIAVIAVNFVLTDYQNQRARELDTITQHLDYVRFKGQRDRIRRTLHLENLMPQDRSNFFRYNGSLTTPPCQESVIWTVFQNTLNVTRLQLHDFRQLYTTEKSEDRLAYMEKNYRPTQPLNGRKVQIRREIPDLPHRSGTDPAKRMSFSGLAVVALALRVF